MPERTDADLFQEFAQIALAAGRPDVAGECLRRAALSPASSRETAEQLHSAAIQFLNQNQLAEAETLLGRAIRLRPPHAEWHDHLGVTLARQKRLPEAEATFRLAVQLNPSLGSALRNLIQCCLEQRKFQAAEQAIREAMHHDPNNVELALQLAAVLGELKQQAEALAILKTLNEQHPANPLVWNRLGVQWGLLDELSKAEDCFREQIRLDPETGSGYANLAAALGKQKKWAEAIEAGLQATQREPNNPQGWANLGNAYRDLGQLPQAIKALEEAVRLEPGASEAAGNLGLTIAMMGQPQAALPWYDYALKLKPDAAEIRFNRAIALLWLGNYERGWPEYEWRWRTEQMRSQPRHFPVPAWDGSSLQGKTILLHAEQGHGDTIQFCRFIPLVKQQGARVLLTAPATLAGLLHDLPGVDQLLENLEQIKDYHVHCPLMSLPLRLGIRLEALPATAYLQASPDAVLKWKTRLEPLAGRKIGLVWQGNPGHIGDRFRSIRLAQLTQLRNLPNISWISLQKGPGCEQLDEFPDWPMHRFGEELSDFSDTAGLLANLDLLISVDTATVHLMGALGKPAWVVLPLNNDWRWLQGRNDSPWYPSVRLFRQSQFGQWDPVIQQVRQELERLPA